MAIVSLVNKSTEITVMPDIEKVRSRSESILRERLGTKLTLPLPTIDDQIVLRPLEETIYRVLTLHAVAAKAFGYPKEKALDWLESEGCLEKLSMNEKEFIEQPSGNVEYYKTYVEAIWVLTGALSIHDDFDPFALCANNLISLLPDLGIKESSAGFRNIACYRDTNSLVGWLDLLYCMHWLVTDSAINKKVSPFGLNQYVIVRRRHAIEWCFSKVGWDAIQIDT